MTAAEATKVDVVEKEEEFPTVFRVARDKPLVAVCESVIASLEKHETILLEASGVAIGKCISLAESVKRKTKLWQCTKTGCKEQETTYKGRQSNSPASEEKTDEGEEAGKPKLKVSTIHITLSKSETAISKSEPGFQAPVEYTEEEKAMADLSAEDAETKERKSKAKGKGKGKASKKKETEKKEVPKKDKEGEKEDGEKTAKKGKGRGRKGKGRGRKSSAEKTEGAPKNPTEDVMAKQLAA